jgi:hypothetical protein
MGTKPRKPARSPELSSTPNEPELPERWSVQRKLSYGDKSACSQKPPRTAGSVARGRARDDASALADLAGRRQELGGETRRLPDRHRPFRLFLHSGLVLLGHCLN